MSAPKPPRRALLWLERWLPDAEREELIGDLTEEFEERALVNGRKAQRWFWRQTFGLILNRRRLASPMLSQDAPTHGPLADAGADWKVAARSLRRSPAFAAVAILTMVVSLGLATTVFSIVNAIVLTPLPFPSAERIVRLGAVSASGTSAAPRIATVGGPPPPPGLSGVIVGAWMSRRKTVEAIAVYSAFTQTIELEGEALRVSVADVGSEFFEILPARPIAGRTLQRSDADPTSSPVAVISERLTRQRQADPGILIGRSLQLYERPFQIAGILPADFEWPDNTVDVWVVDRTRWPAPGAATQMGRLASTLGLLRPGMTPADARQEGQQLVAELAANGAVFSAAGGPPPNVIVRPLSQELLEPVWTALVLLSLGTIAVVVAANVNLAGFLLSRNTARKRDLGVRQALGATRWRLLRPLLFEQLLTAGIGGAGAIALAWALINLLPIVGPPDLPRLSAVAIDAWSFVFVSVAALVTAVCVGVWPARGFSSDSLRDIVADGGQAVAGTGRRSEWTRSTLVVCQVTVAVVLLVGSALLGRSLIAMLHIDLGYRPEGVLTFQVGTPFEARHQPGRLTTFYTELIARLNAHPDVVTVGTSSALPLHGDTLRSSFNLPGLTPPREPGTPPLMAHREEVHVDYLPAIGATVRQGRHFSQTDTRESELVAIVNEAFVRTFMPGANPLAQVIPISGRRTAIVGVIAQIKRAAATMGDDPAVYLPASQRPEGLAFSATRGMGVAVRTTGDPMSIAPLIRDTVRELDRSAPLYNLMPLEQRLGRTFAQPRFFALALAMFAVLALATALLGVYGVLASSVERRRVELGVRRALGATTADILGLVMGQAVRLAAIGMAFGVAIAVGGATLGRSMLYGIEFMDAVSYLAAVVAIFVVVLLGAWVPMRTALRIDPARVLRTG